MEIVLTQKDATNALLKVTLKEADYQKNVAEKVKEYSKKAQIKGFRPGKVPMGLIHKMYGKGILAEEVNQLLSKSVSEYIQEQKIMMVGDPLPAENAANDDVVNFDQPSDFVFHLEIGMAAPFEIPYEQIQVAYLQINAPEEEVDKVVENFLKQNPQTSNPEESAQDDFVYGSLVQEESEFSQPYAAIPTDKLKEAARAQFIGLRKDAQVKFKVEELFEEKEAVRYLLGVFDDEKIAALEGKEMTLTVTDIVRHSTPELNEEFFKKIFPNEELSDEAAFRAQVQKIIGENYQTEADKVFEFELEDAIINKANITLPETFLKKWLGAVNENLAPEVIEREYPVFAKELSWGLVQRKIMEGQDIKVEYPEVQAKAKEILGEEFKKYGISNLEMLGDFSKMVEGYLREENGKNFRRTYDLVLKDKVLGYIKSNVQVENKPATPQDLEQVIKAINEKLKPATEEGQEASAE